MIHVSTRVYGVVENSCTRTIDSAAWCAESTSGELQPHIEGRGPSSFTSISSVVPSLAQQSQASPSPSRRTATCSNLANVTVRTAPSVGVCPPHVGLAPREQSRCPGGELLKPERKDGSPG